MGNAPPPVHSVKLKIVYGFKTSKLADLDIISIQIFYAYLYYVPYSWKYWQELNLVVESKMAITKKLILADLDLAVW